MAVAEMGKRGAGGRPPLTRKGDVDARLLEAATQLFLTLGFEGTSCDQVAQNARAGKASIYARYANKSALFGAVIEANLARLFAAEEGDDALQDAPLRQRLISAGTVVIHNALQADAVALLRLMVAEAPRLQGSAHDATRVLHTLGAEHIARALAGSPDPAALQAAAMPATALIEAALMPALLRSLLGDDPAALRDTAIGNLPAAVDRLIASGAVDRWREATGPSGS